MLTGFICGHSSEMQTAEQQQQRSHCANYTTLEGIWRTCTGIKMYHLLLYSVQLTMCISFHLFSSWRGCLTYLQSPFELPHIGENLQSDDSYITVWTIAADSAITTTKIQRWPITLLKYNHIFWPCFFLNSTLPLMRTWSGLRVCCHLVALNGQRLLVIFERNRQERGWIT